MPARITSTFISLLGLALMFTSDAGAQVKTGTGADFAPDASAATGGTGN
jgi:hypothetical protein